MRVVFDNDKRVIRIFSPVTFAELFAQCLMFCDNYADYTIETVLITTWGEQIEISQDLKYMVHTPHNNIANGN